MRVYLCGTRGSLPATGAEFVRYGGHTPCVAIARDRSSVPELVLDAGSGIARVTALMHGAPFRGTILLTHLHWDHVQGLPFFSAAEVSDAAVRLLLPAQPGDPTAESVLERPMSPPHFPITPSQLRGAWTFESLEPGTHALTEPFTVTAREIPHKGGRTYGYRISDGHSVLTYMPDHCPTVLGPGPDGDGELHPDAVALAADADLLIHDAQLLPEERAESDFGHAVTSYAHALAAAAGARQVLLFHHKPSRTDEQLDALAARFAEDPRVDVAADGAIYDLS